MSISKIKTGSITTDAITEAKVADAAIENEHLNTNVVLGQTELAEVAANNDIFLVYDTSSGTLKKILSSNVGITPPTFSSVSPTNVTTGDGTGNATFTITGTNFDASVTARLRTTAGVDVNFDSVTRDSATQITAVIAISSLSNANEPYDVVIVNGTGLQVVATDQININAQPVYVTASGSLGDNTVGQAGSFSVNATDPESAGNVTFELQSGSLPPSYSITNTAAEGGTAIISGTDSTTSSTTTFNFVLRAVDAASNTTSRAFSIRSRVLTTESFTSSGTFSVPSGITSADVLVVAGGGTGANQHGGGGGAGGLIFFPSFPLTPGGTVTVTVGCGGSTMGPGPSINPSPSFQGQDSVFGTLTAKGGGYGGTYCGSDDPKTAGKPGGSGGGGGYKVGGSTVGTGIQPTQPGNSGAYGFGSNGGIGYGPPSVPGYGGGGGGGAGAAGADGDSTNPLGGPGGVGKAYTIADGTTPVYYAGGGGGGAHQIGQGGCGGQGGGGQGNKLHESQPGPAQSGQAGQANKGGGGGSGTSASHLGGAGGKGIVVVRY
jgi:hypothetical protein